MTQEFFRNQTEEEKRDFKDIGPYQNKDPKSKFMDAMCKKRIESQKLGKPFFKKAAIDDFNEHYSNQAKTSLRMNGYVKSEDITLFEPNWDKYSSVENIKFIEIRDVRDPNLSKKFPYDIFFKEVRYKYIGYGPNNMANLSVMEPEQFAMKRAKALWDNTPELIEESMAEKESRKYGNKSPVVEKVNKQSKTTDDTKKTK